MLLRRGVLPAPAGVRSLVAHQHVSQLTGCSNIKEALGHGLRAKRSKNGAISFDLLEVADAPL